VGKGIIERDLVTGAHSFHPLPPTRRYIDLPPIDGHGQSSAELDVSIAQAVSTLGESLDDAVVRLVVTDVPVHIARELDHKAIRDWRRRALHFQLETRRPVQGVRTSGTGAPGRAEPLPDLLRGMLMQRTLQSDIDRTALVELGRRYLEDAARIEEARGLSAEDSHSPVVEVLPAPSGVDV
jgi:exonuclease SbcD